MKKLFISLLILFIFPLFSFSITANKNDNPISITTTQNNSKLLNYYLNDLQLRLKHNLIYNSFDKNFTGVSIKIKLDKNGNLISSYINKSSGNKRIDDNCLASITYSAPFPPLPKTVISNFLEVTVRFGNFSTITPTKMPTSTTNLKKKIVVNNNIDESKYCKNVQTKIIENWRPPLNSSNKTRCEAILTIKKTGLIESIVIDKPSSNKKFNNSVIQAISTVKADPFPKEFTKAYIKMVISFNTDLKEDNTKYILDSYFNYIRDELFLSWNITKQTIITPGTAILSFNINPYGEFENIRIIQSSGFIEFDNSILDAVKLINPKCTPPTQYNGEEIQIPFVIN